MRAGYLMAVLCGVLSSLAPSEESLAAYGRTEGSFGVSADGAATYGVPIWTPEGPRGMTPSLALSYSSLGGNGPLGVGWSVSGYSAIERCSRAYPIDGGNGPIQMNNNDAYCIGVNRLRVKDGNYGAANSTYGLEVDDYSVITASSSLQGSGPQSFTMLSKNGLTYEYGTTADSRVTFGTNTTVLRWLLKKVRDRDGNSYQISYEISEGVEVPTEIAWSPTVPNGSTYRYKAVFAWGNKTDPKDWISSFVAGNPVLSKKRLANISIDQGSTTVRKYVLSYGVGALTGFSRLTSITECADKDATDCLPPTAMSYQSGQALLTSSSTVSVASGGTIRGSADFNGDKKDDLVYTAGSSWYVLFGRNGGFSSPVLVSGLTGTFGTTVDYDNFLPGGRAAFIALINGTLYSFSANASGSAFTQASTGITISQGFVPTGISTSASDLADLVWTETTTSIPPDIIRRSNNTTRPEDSVPSFGPPFNGHTIPQLVTINGTPMKVRAGSVQFISDRGLDRRDFEGDGWPEFYGTLAADYCEPQNSNTCYYGRYYTVLFGRGGFDVAPPNQWVEYTYGVYPVPPSIRFNDDECSDVVGVAVANCVGGSGAPLPAPGSGIWLDWDGDGRSDFATNNGSGLIAVQRSAGTSLMSALSTDLPYFGDYRALDLDGDGLDDLARVDGATIRYYTHSAGPTAYLTQYPDLLDSITDGYGVKRTVNYQSTAHSNAAPGELVAGLTESGKRIVVARITQADGIGDTYQKDYTYIGGREDTLRGTFMGFQQRNETDSRSGLITRTYYRQAFPLTGWVWKTEVYRNEGSVLLARNEVTDRVHPVESASFRQRHFPYIEGILRETFEPEGSATLITRQQTSFQDYDFDTGNARTVVETLENGGGGDKWQSTTTLEYFPRTNSCMDLLSKASSVLDRIAPDQPAVTRTVSFMKDGALCRHKERTVEPGTNFAVVTTYGYDSFGNVNSTAVQANEPSIADPNAYQAMASRLTSIYWGSAGLAPESITNALNETSTLGYYPATGLLQRVTDPNGAVTSLQYDGFGRVKEVVRPDRTSTTSSYLDCSAAGCINGSQHRMTEVHTEKDAGGIEINRQFRYLDAFDRLLATRTPLLGDAYQWRETRYDALGRIAKTGIPCSTTQPAGSCTNAWVEFTSYDLLGRPKRVEQPADEALTRKIASVISYSGLATSVTVVTDALTRTRSRVMDVTGNLRQSIDANGYYQEFSYDSVGSLIEVREQTQPGRDPVLFAAQYDYGLAAFQKTSVDRALGARSRWYDGLGQLRRWTDAKGQLFFADYDALSRLRSQVAPDTAKSFVFGNDPSSYNVGQLISQSSTSSGETYTETFFYDSAGRVRQQNIILPGEASPYTYDFAYHPSTGQLDTLTYPASTSAYRLALKYNVNAGVLTSIANANSPSTVYWSLDTASGGLNALGQVTHDTLGPIVRQRSYDAVTGGLEQFTAGSAANATTLQNASVNYDDFGNAYQRQNSLATLPAALTENFEYGEPGVDGIDRLTNIDLNNGTETRALRYDPFGNIELLTANGTGTPEDLVPVDLSITWTSSNYPRTISAPWKSATASFAYGPDQQRWRMVYQNGSASETTYYLGLMEKVVTSLGTEFRHYIPGPEEMIALYSRASSGTNTLRYLLSDHLGSLDTVADSTGAALVRASYSAYGVPRDPLDWSGSSSTTPESITRQGFTFQTVLGRMGLVHMNGRVHDAISGTFISPDPFIPDPTNTQSFNRYAYVYNNPLTYTDPSGFSPDGPQCFSVTFCGWDPIIPRDFLDDDGPLGPWINCLRAGGCSGAWYYLRNHSPKVAVQTAPERMDGKAVAKVASVMDTTRRVILPYSAELGERGVEGTLKTNVVGALKAAYNLVQQAGAMANPIAAVISSPHQVDIADDELGGAAIVEFGSMVIPVGALRSITSRVAASGRNLIGLCFAPGTIVQTENGPKRIEDVQVGEKVWSWDEGTEEIVLAEVAETFVREDQELVSVRLGNAGTHETIKSTSEHPYWTKRGWVGAKDLASSDVVLSKGGEWLTIAGVTQSGERSKVYNFEVKGTHSYFVGHLGGLVHNQSRLNIITRLFHGTDAQSAKLIAERGIDRAAARELGGGDIFWATSDKGVATVFANANPVGGSPGIVALDIPASSLQALIKSGAVALDRTGAYMIKNWKAFNSAVIRRTVEE